MGRPRKDIPVFELRRLYLKEELTTYQIAKMYGYSQQTVSLRLREYGIPTRVRSEGRTWHLSDETKAKLRDAHMRIWDERGRVTPEHELHVQRGAWKARAKECYARDKWTCQECGIHCNSKGKTRIQAHHVIPRIEGGSDDLDNLKTLCASCHTRLENAASRRNHIALHFAPKGLRTGTA